MQLDCIIISKRKIKTKKYVVWSPDSQRDLIYEIKKLNPSYIITEDLAGFDRCTLTDNIAYNLLSCIQIHFLSKTQLKEEIFLTKPVSIAMFFFCKESSYDYYQTKYPQLPYIGKIPDEYFDEEHSFDDSMKIKVDMALTEIENQDNFAV